MAGLVTTLKPGQTLAAGDYFAGPWRDFQHLRLAPGQREEFVADNVELAAFVISGSGAGAIGDDSVLLREGVSLTVGLGSRVAVTAGQEGLDVFVTRLDVAADPR
ncbi:hypothetical protein [Nonomuraea sp. B1E8]|uniref:hypothetical protein n=1 Tax=unclassified Nonomuraea TaxID=2593643 RepID=UPI00325EBD10